MKKIVLFLLSLSSAYAFEPEVVSPVESAPEIIVEVNENDVLALPTAVAPVTKPISTTPTFTESFTRSTGAIVQEISTSRFFLEFKPFKFNYTNLSAKSDLMVNSYNVYEERSDIFKAKMLALDFRFGFENANWGSFADIEIEGDSQFSEFTVYSNGPFAKVGFGIILDFENVSSTTKTFGEIVSETNKESLEISPYFYFAFKFAENDSVAISQWNKVGSIFNRDVVSDVELTGLGVRYNAGLDIMFKVNKNVQVGLGLEFDLKAIRIEIEDLPDASTSALEVDFEIDLFKVKYLF